MRWKLSALLPELTGTKSYTHFFQEHGFEMGIGRAGSYSGHSHRRFFDVLFSPEGALCIDAYRREYRGNLIIVPPRTWYETPEIGGFFFLKFPPDERVVVLPEKTLERSAEGIIKPYISLADECMQWWSARDRTFGSISLRLENDVLSVCIGNILEVEVMS